MKDEIEPKVQIVFEHGEKIGYERRDDRLLFVQWMHPHSLFSCIPCYICCLEALTVGSSTVMNEIESKFEIVFENT